MIRIADTQTPPLTDAQEARKARESNAGQHSRRSEHLQRHARPCVKGARKLRTIPVDADLTLPTDHADAEVAQ